MGRGLPYRVACERGTLWHEDSQSKQTSLPAGTIPYVPSHPFKQWSRSGADPPLFSSHRNSRSTCAVCSPVLWDVLSHVGVACPSPSQLMGTTPSFRGTDVYQSHAPEWGIKMLSLQNWGDTEAMLSHS
ncbi:hypothetical protein SKAU_G00182370 [Synaphobranchus kaupii]|uniref:Uncharacterized protein n=1 Tax=Synaphobranchus kaupii TaxID=118154 RepID=A0A9Q1FBT2_SYNKA|nr:hypothetical protein SKAU_G00182370 [Synaphobranchus kaupii]